MQAHRRNEEIAAAVLNGDGDTLLRRNENMQSLIMDTLPLVSRLIAPNIRPVSLISKSHFKITLVLNATGAKPVVLVYSFYCLLL